MKIFIPTKLPKGFLLKIKQFLTFFCVHERYFDILEPVDAPIYHLSATLDVVLKVFLKTHRQISKNSVSKSVFPVIKHANFQLYRVHPD